MATISVIIPIYNTEKYLRRCLDSIVDQTYADWEAICVNDGSTDSSLSILQEYADRDARFKIIDKPNGGQSDARNAGLDAATGEFINFVDSDDLIHPQTFEIATALAQREHSDIVTWYKDPHFRPALFVRHALGMPIDNTRPRGLKKRFALNAIDYHTTDDAFAHVVQGSGKGMEYPIKRFYVWRHLLRRELAGRVHFVKGLIFEDFLWWSEILLLNPRVTITQLPFYYYFPNFHSTDLGSTRSHKITNWLQGLAYAWELYEEKATDYQRRMWALRCMWPVVNYQIVGKMPLLRDAEGKEAARGKLRELWAKGVFASPPGRREEQCRQKIKHFIDQ